MKSRCGIRYSARPARALPASKASEFVLVIAPEAATGSPSRAGAGLDGTCSPTRSLPASIPEGKRSPSRHTHRAVVRIDGRSKSAARSTLRCCRASGIAASRDPPGRRPYRRRPGLPPRRRTGRRRDRGPDCCSSPARSAREPGSAPWRRWGWRLAGARRAPGPPTTQLCRPQRSRPLRTRAPIPALGRLTEDARRRRRRWSHGDGARRHGIRRLLPTGPSAWLDGAASPVAAAGEFAGIVHFDVRPERDAVAAIAARPRFVGLQL